MRPPEYEKKRPLRSLMLVMVILVSSYQSQGAERHFYFDNYTVNNGLSYNYIDCIYQDSEGWIWIGTGMGIERFDGIRFKPYNLYINDSTYLEGLLVRQIYQDSKQNLWVCYEDLGLARYNRNLDRFESILMIEPAFKKGFSAKDVTEDREGNLWIATKGGVICYNPDKHSITKLIHNSSSRNSLQDNYVRKLVFDVDGKLWIGTRSGLDLYNTTSGEFVHFNYAYQGLDDDILEIWIDGKGRKWIGTAMSGIILIDETLNSYTSFIPGPEEERSRKVNSIHEAIDGRFWIGTRGGLFILDPEAGYVTHFKHNELLPKSLVHNSILHIMEDNKGDMWIATRGGLSYLSHDKQNFIHYLSIPENNKYLNNSEVYSIWLDPDDKIWLGTEAGGINILDRSTGEFLYLTTATAKGLSSDCIKTIFPLDERLVLVGTFQGGLNIVDWQTLEVQVLRHDPDDPNSISSDIVWDIAKDSEGQIWVGTGSGLDRFDITSHRFVHYSQFSHLNGISWLEVDSDGEIWMGAQEIIIFSPISGRIRSLGMKARGIFEDSKGRIWINTVEHGIALYNKEKGIQKEYNEEAGIASKLTYCIQEDKSGKLWVSTANGLSLFDPETGAFRNFSARDGLQGNQFYYGSSAKSRDGELFFGGINGLTIFDPDKIGRNQFIPPVYLTDLKIFNESVNIENSKNAILKKSITDTKEVTIPFRYNVISIDFAALNYTNSDENQYMYILEGFDAGWNKATEGRSASYTNLDPGDYTFRVKASNNDDIWNEAGATLGIHVQPPFRMTLLFKLLVFISVAAIIFFAFRFLLNRRELRKELGFEKERAKNMHEVDAFKWKFFTNISHELKTPLTLILSPLNRLKNKGNLNQDERESISIMERNAQHLLRLVTQLLDYGKLEEGKLQIELKLGDLVEFCRGIFGSFRFIMDEKKLDYSFRSSQEEIVTWFDPGIVKLILNNLLSNAVKFNRPNGMVDFFISLEQTDKNEAGTSTDKQIHIVIRDTGSGINAKDMEKIFTRYYSSPSNGNLTNSGIGLAFARELIELHSGQIRVESVEGKGSSFTVVLPLLNENFSTSRAEKPDIKGTVDFLRSPEFEIEQRERKILLFIDDNQDILSFMRLHFKDRYIVLLAERGEDGYNIAAEAIPDLILTDIMLPDLDGRELSRKLKDDERTSHIPVILVSALSSAENMLHGLESGADDYISKPFDISLLQIKIDNLLSTRDALIEKYSRQVSLMPTNHKVASPDERFLSKALKFIEANIDNAEFEIDDFASEMGVSRMQLYRKIAALTNMTVKECVTDIRMKRAAQILSQSKMNISEVAYSVGFNDLSYFGKCFKKKYGESPTEFMKRKNRGDLVTD